MSKETHLTAYQTARKGVAHLSEDEVDNWRWEEDKEKIIDGIVHSLEGEYNPEEIDDLRQAIFEHASSRYKSCKPTLIYPWGRYENQRIHTLRDWR